MDLSSVTKALFFIGIGVITVSGFLVGTLYARDADKEPSDHMDKLRMKISYDGTKEVRDSGISIAVFGFFAFAAAVATIVLSLLLDNGMIIMICGIITAVFTLGCVISEGLYTNYVISKNSINAYDPQRNHKSAQNYIKESIKELYNHALQNWKSSHPSYDMEKVATWQQVEEKLGKADSDGKIITYDRLWGKSIQYENFLSLYVSNAFIYAAVPGASYNNRVRVASLNFAKKNNYKDYPSKQRVCWFNDEKTDIKCKKIKIDQKKFVDEEYHYQDIEDFVLNEDIVVGEYNSDRGEANYLVSNFPVAYALCDTDTNYFDIFEEDSRHFKVSGKDLVKASYKDMIDDTKDSVNHKFGNFFLAPKEPSDYNDLDNICSDEKYEGTDFCDTVDFTDLVPTIISHYKDYNKGKVPPSIKKFYKSYYRYSYKEGSWMNQKSSYNFAIINMSAQLFGILLWALGTFIPGGYAGVGNS